MNDHKFLSMFTILIKPVLFIMLGLIVLLPIAVQASVVAVGPLQIDYLRISDATNTLYIKPVGNVEVINSSCSARDFYAIDPSDELFNQMYSMLLAAGTAGKKIRVWVSGAASDCKQNRQRVRLVEIIFGS